MPYERYEYTRLNSIRTDMDMHRTFKKETVLGDQDEKEDQEDEEIIRAGDPSAQSPGSNQG